MLAKLATRLTFANVVSVIALFIALGGSSYAAIKVTGKNVTDSSLTGKDVKNNSVTGKDVKGIGAADITNGSLLAQDFGAGQLPAGPAGPAGPQGPQGSQGNPGQNGATSAVIRLGPTDTQTTTAQSFAPCQSGERAVGGGLFTSATGGGAPVVQSSLPEAVAGGLPAEGAIPRVWDGSARNSAGVGSISVTAYAVCASP